MNIDCGYCGGCGENDASGRACHKCGGRGYFSFTPKTPRRDYAAAGRRAREAGKPLDANPYWYGWPQHTWHLGWMGEPIPEAA